MTATLHAPLQSGLARMRATATSTPRRTRCCAYACSGQVRPAAQSATPSRTLLASGQAAPAGPAAPPFSLAPPPPPPPWVRCHSLEWTSANRRNTLARSWVDGSIPFFASRSRCSLLVSAARTPGSCSAASSAVRASCRRPLAISALDGREEGASTMALMCTSWSLTNDQGGHSPPGPSVCPPAHAPHDTAAPP